MSDLITNKHSPYFIQFINIFMFIRKQRRLLSQAAQTLIHHQTLQFQLRNPRRRSRRLNQLRKLRKPRRSNHHHPILIHLMPSQLKKDQELPQMFPLPPREALTKHRKNLKKLLFHKRKLRLSHLPILIHHQTPQLQPRNLRKRSRKPLALLMIAPPMRSQSRKPPKKPKALDLTPDLTPALMPKKRPRLKPQLLLRMPPPPVTSTMVNLNSSFKDSPSTPMRMV